MKGKPTKKDLEFLASFGTRRTKPKYEEVKIGEMLVGVVDIFYKGNWNKMIGDMKDRLNGIYIKKLFNILEGKEREKGDIEIAENIKDYALRKNIDFGVLYT